MIFVHTTTLFFFIFIGQKQYREKGRENIKLSCKCISEEIIKNVKISFLYLYIGKWVKKEIIIDL